MKKGTIMQNGRKLHTNFSSLLHICYSITVDKLPYRKWLYLAYFVNQGKTKKQFWKHLVQSEQLIFRKPQVDILTYSVIDTLCSCIIIMQQKAHWCGCTPSFTWSSLPDCKLRIVWVTELSLLSVVVTSTMFFSLDLALAPRQACRQTQ